VDGPASGDARSSTVTARLFVADGHDEVVELDDAVVRSLDARRLLWVDVDGRDPDALRRVVDTLRLPEAHVERIARDHGRAHLGRSEDQLHVTLESLEPGDRTDRRRHPRLERREIDLVAAPNILLTVHEGHVAALDRFREGLEGETRLGATSAAGLLSALVDEVIVGYHELVEVIEREIDELDQRALESRRGEDVLGQMVALRRRVAEVRRTLAPHREALTLLGQPELGADEGIGRPWPGLVERLDGAMVAVEGLRDALLGTFDIHMGRVSQRANDVMRTLTLLSAVLLPAVVLAGIMGMNFKLPFFEDASNFWLVAGAMGAMAGAILGVAAWRRWL
jgi:magnesium transporter